MKENEHKVLNSLYDDNGQTSYELEKNTGLDVYELDDSVKTLQNRGHVCEVKFENMAYYITEAGKGIVRRKREEYDRKHANDNKIKVLKK